MHIVIFLPLFACCSIAFAAAPAPAVNHPPRQIDIKGIIVKTNNGDGPGVPIKITSNDELAKALEQAKAADAKKRQDRIAR